MTFVEKEVEIFFLQSASVAEFLISTHLSIEVSTVSHHISV